MAGDRSVDGQVTGLAGQTDGDPSLPDVTKLQYVKSQQTFWEAIVQVISTGSSDPLSLQLE